MALAPGATEVICPALPWRIVVWVSASVGSTAWRCMSGTIATSRPDAGSVTVSVCSWAVEP